MATTQQQEAVAEITETSIKFESQSFFSILKEIVVNKKIKPYEKTETAYKEILESKKKAYDQKNAELRKQRMAKETEKSKN